MYEIHGDYDVKWSNGQVSTVSGIGVLLRTLAHYPDAEPDWSALSESDAKLARSIVDARTVNPPPQPQHQIQVRHLAGNVVALIWTNGVTFRAAYLTESEADAIAAEMVRRPGKAAS